MLKQLLTIGLLATLFSACTDTRGTRIAYGNKGSEVFYTEHVTADEAKRFGDFLDKTLDFFSGDAISVQLDKDTNGDYLFRMVSADGAENRADFISSAKSACRAVSEEVFDNKPVHFHFLNAKYELKRVVFFESLGLKQVTNGVVFYLKDKEAPSGLADFASQFKLSSLNEDSEEPVFQIKHSHDSCYITMLDRQNKYLDPIYRQKLQDNLAWKMLGGQLGIFYFGDFDLNSMGEALLLK